MSAFRIASAVGVGGLLVSGALGFLHPPSTVFEGLLLWSPAAVGTLLLGRAAGHRAGLGGGGASLILLALAAAVAPAGSGAAPGGYAGAVAVAAAVLLLAATAAVAFLPAFGSDGGRRRMDAGPGSAESPLLDEEEILAFLDESLPRARAGGSLSLALLELEGFSEYRETSGGAETRRYRLEVEQAIAEGVPGPGRVGRFEEDRFLMVLPEQTTARASTIADAVRMNVAPLDCPRPDPFPISAGVVAYADGGTEPQELLDRVRETLRQAVAVGGDRVMVLRRGAYREGPLPPIRPE